MKKISVLFMTFVMIIVCMSPVNVFAGDATEDDFYISDEEFEMLEHIDAVYEDETRATGLIIAKYLGIAKEDNTFIIKGYTKCIPDVVKCGFKTLLIQRRRNSSSAWEDYKEYNSLYIDGHYYSLTKRNTVMRTYQYRVKATHYAKKSLFSTQKIEITTGYLTV